MEPNQDNTNSHSNSSTKASTSSKTKAPSSSDTQASSSIKAHSSSSSKSNSKSKSRATRRNYRQIASLVSYAVLAIAIIFVLFFVASTNATKKMTCEAPGVNIVISYDDQGITGYSAYGMSYDLSGQREYSSKVGLEPYLLEFEEWFQANTEGGVCHR